MVINRSAVLFEKKRRKKNISVITSGAKIWERSSI
jgi:hypothetical protein